MPNYQFECRNNSKCNNGVIVIPMKMSEYTDEQYCPICGSKLSRTIESLVCGYEDAPGFYGKSSN